MIVEFFFTLGTSIATWLAGLFEPLTIPGWVTTSLPGLYSFLDTASGLGVWIPWPVIGVIVGGLVLWYLGLFAVKLLLKVWSILPFGGG